MSLSLSKWTKDVEEFLELLQIKTFSLIGYSAGGPWSLAIASSPAFKHRIISFYCCSSIAPRATPNVYYGMPFAYKIAWWSGRNFPWLLGFAIRDSASKFLKEDLKALKEDWRSYGCKEDSDFFAQDEFVQQLFLECTKEMYSKGQFETEIAEHKLFASDWDFGKKKFFVLLLNHILLFFFFFFG
jgi:pimeloyl-ACP methyl ester carboxylesterase